MRLFDTRHLIIRACVQLIVGDGSSLGLELVELERDVSVFKLLHLDGIGCVVNEYIGVYTDIYKVDDIIFG